ncbi:MAG: penicillin-binding transpeptidase domain-containing protein [Candidatus Riflebacteria bacterium]|nr:penicillin-binding transpeptidase domain-containing protein [Candidatus Riflebacteria bacterium]
MFNSSKFKSILFFVTYVTFLVFTLDLKVVDALSLPSGKKNTAEGVSKKFEITPTKELMKANSVINSPTNDTESKVLIESGGAQKAENNVEETVKTVVKEDNGPSALDYIKAIKEKKWEYAPIIDRYIVRYDANSYIVLTIRPELQEMIESVLAKYDTRMSVGIIQDPYTGEILAMSSSNKNLVTNILEDDYKTDNWALQAAFPSASIFKIITSAAGIDSGKLTPNSNFISEQKRYMKVWKAFATSHNGVFGRMARQIGKETLEKYTNLFGFNRPFFFDLPVSKSIADFPQKQAQFEEAAAGLNKSFLISPIHVSNIVSTVINRGRTLKPYLVDYVIRNDKVVFKRKPFMLGKPVKLETATLMHKMMYATTAVGTAKKGFGGYKTCPNLSKFCGGKTGTLTGAYPNYLFTWFGGFTKITGRMLTITTLVGQSDHSAVRAPSVAGQIAFELFKKAKNGKAEQIVYK